MQAILFDLDGTLLDIDIDRFLTRYFAALGDTVRQVAPEDERHGAAMQAIYDATGAMMRPHPGRTNKEAFDEAYLEATGIDMHEHAPVFDHFYAEVFPTLRDGIGPRPGAEEVFEVAREYGLKVAIATNPIFPASAIRHRLEWAGIDWTLADLVTSYENMLATKPLPQYYRQISTELGVAPDECIMVGDDRALDLPAADIGMRTFYVGSDTDAPSDYRGDLGDLAELIRRLFAE